jgi:DNA-directed RNA polymerase subunit M/transcription elongation factor TFIIS
VPRMCRRSRRSAIIRAVTEPDDAVVRFACPRCFARLKAPLAQVGAKRRCPRCQWVFPVPTAAEAARRRCHLGEYGISEGMESSPAALQPQTTLTCPVCSALISATEDQVGRQMRCPDCDTPVVVPPPAKVETKRNLPAFPVEEYALYDEVDASARGPRPADQTYVPVTCPVCGTFMQVLEDQVGQTVVCPDCRKPMIVRWPVEAAEETSARWGVCADATPAHRRAANLGEYALRDEGEDPFSDAGEQQRSQFSVRCPLCDTLMYAQWGQVGQQMICGDCQTSFVVPRPPATKQKPDLQAQAGDVYDVGDAIEVPEYEPSVVIPGSRPRPGAESAADRDRQAAAVRPKPPRWTFFSGIFGFPAYRNSWPRWLGLSVGLIVPLWVGQFAVKLALGPAAPWGGAGPWIGAVILCGVTFVFGAIWAVVAFAQCLAIVRDTSYGYDGVENWPEALFLDWIGDFSFVISSLAVSVLPGLAVGRTLESFGVVGWPSVPTSLVLVFPISLLAMLETNSPLNPFSLPVWRSLLTAWWAWGLFYIETTVLLAAAGWLTWLSATSVPVWGIALAAPVLVPTLMVYSRLLGRLAWHCGGGRARGHRSAGVVGGGPPGGGGCVRMPHPPTTP